jgi:hypothetical protein
MVMEDIVRLCKQRKIRWTNHILVRLFQRNISIDDVVTVLSNGEIIEQYPADYPFPSCLVSGSTTAGKYLHVVCGSDGAELWLITTYFPDPAEWSEDYKVRREETK